MTRLPTKTYGNCLLGLHCSQNDPTQSRIPAGQRVVAGRQQRHCQQVIHRLLLTSSAIRGPVRSFNDDLSYPDQQWRAQRVDCSQIPTRSSRVINSNCARKRLARCATSSCIFCNKKSRKPFWSLRDRFSRLSQISQAHHLLGRISTYCALSPRRTSTFTGRPFSNLAKADSNWRTLAT